MIGFALTGSFCTIEKSLGTLKRLVDNGYDVIPITSDNVYNTDTRFGKSKDTIARLETICGHSVIHSIVDSEPLGPKVKLDAMIICPCTGNTMAKIANGITDTPVCMAAKAHLRNNKPLIVTLATNDALSANLKNLATLISRKNIYFTPMVQDDPEGKPHSLVADFDLVIPTLESALLGRQYQKIFI